MNRNGPDIRAAASAASSWKLNALLLLGSGLVTFAVTSGFNKPSVRSQAEPARTAAAHAPLPGQILEAALQRKEITEAAVYEAHEKLLEWAASDRVAAVRWIAARGFPWDTMDLCRQLLREARPAEVNGLLAMLTPMLSGQMKDELLPALLGNAALDQGSRIAWLKSAPSLSVRLVAPLLAVARPLADPETLQFLADHSSAPWMQQAISEALQASGNAAAMWEDLAAVQDPGLKQKFQLATIAALSLESPSRAAAAALTIGDFTTRKSAVLGCVTKWAKSDAPGALAWMQSSLHGVERNRVISETLMLLGNQTPREFWPLLDELPSQTLQDRALTYVTPEVPPGLTPAGVLEYTAGWGSRKMIGKALFSYADKLVAADPASALEMVKAESFPEEIRTGALASIIQDMGGTHSGLPERLAQLAGDRAPEVAAAILAAPRTALPLATLNALTEIAARPHQPPQTR